MGQSCSVSKATSKELPISGLGSNFNDDYQGGARLSAKVAEAKHKVTGTIRVVYQLKKELHACRDGVLLGARMKALQKLEHPGACQYFEAYAAGSFTYLVYQKLGGRKVLEEMAKQRSITESKVAGIMRQVLQALQAGQQNGLAHGNLSPKNIFVNSAGVVSITDLGLAGYFKPLPARDCNLEDMQYMAPEVAQRWLSERLIRQKSSGVSVAQAEVDRVERDQRTSLLMKETITSCADIWSCGMLLILLLTGKPPYDYFQSSDQVQLAESIGSFRLPLDISLSGEVRALLQHMLKSNPAERPSLDTILASPWFNQTSAEMQPPLPRDVCEQLATAHCERHTKQLMMRIVAAKIPARKMGKLRLAFSTMDCNSDGQISMAEFKAGLMQHPELATDVEEAFKGIDYHTSGFISLEEFLAATVDTQRHLVESCLLDAFRAVDTNADGALTFKEVERAVRSIGGEGADVLLELLREEVHGALTFTQFKDLVLTEGCRSLKVNQVERGGVSFCGRVFRGCGDLIHAEDQKIAMALGQERMALERQGPRSVSKASSAFSKRTSGGQASPSSSPGRKASHSLVSARRDGQSSPESSPGRKASPPSSPGRRASRRPTEPCHQSVDNLGTFRNQDLDQERAQMKTKNENLVPHIRNEEPPQAGETPDANAAPQDAVSEKTGTQKKARENTRNPCRKASLNPKKFTSNTGCGALATVPRTFTRNGCKLESCGKTLEITGRKSPLAAGKFGSGHGRKTISAALKN